MRSERTILVVDDEPSIRLSLAAKLEQEGYRVLEARNLAEARETLSEAPDLVFLDHRLPDGLGLDLLDEIRERHPALPVIMLTGLTNPKREAEALRAGVFHFACKPVDLDTLGDLAATALEDRANLAAATGTVQGHARLARLRKRI